MRISRIHVPQADQPGSQLALPEGAHAHLVRVLRLGNGASVEVFNGRGGRFVARLEDVTKRSARLIIGQALEPTPPSPLATHLGLVMSKGDRMDFALQKATELGVSEITPLTSEHCDLRLKVDRVEKKQQHWQGVIASACEQCGQDTLPLLHPVNALQSWLTSCAQPLKLVLHTAGESPQWPAQPPASIAFLVGPEGGLSEQEVASALQQGFESWQLGQRVLRTETAPLAMLTILQHRWGDLS